MRLSVVVPVAAPTVRLSDVVLAYGGALEGLEQSFEVVVAAAPNAVAPCTELAAQHEWLVCRPVPTSAWGRGVREGLAVCQGEILCYTNWQRTPPAALVEILRYALAGPDLVLRANRRTRDTRRQRLGSLLFNLECRTLLGTTAWDINGTPKAFSRERSKLLQLRRDDDLIDAEFAVVCEEKRYSVAEIPIDADPLAGLAHKPDYVAALRMYFGVLQLRRQHGR